MPTDVLMPRLADTLTEGTVARWLKAANDSVQAGEPIAEIETDKVTTELTAPASGTLSEFLVAEGETVSIGTPLVRIHKQGEQEPSSRDPEAPIATGEVAPVPPERRASPLAARIAQAHGIDLTQVDTPGSRITRVDVERHLTLSGQPPAEVSFRPVKLAPRDGSVAQQMPASLSDKMLPLTGLRRATAARMSGLRQIPTGCAVVEADVTELEQFYMQERDAWLERFGFPLTYTPFFLYALAQCLRAWPEVRQALRNDQPEPREPVHVGVAVALEDGLIVPVIRDADRKDLRTLAHAQADLVARARSRHLRPDEVTGGVATLTNVGSMAGLLAFPMLNEDQAVILGVGAVTRRAVGASDGIHYHSCVYLSLTFDRRLLSDLQAERFLLDVSSRIAHPTWLGEKAGIRT